MTEKKRNGHRQRRNDISSRIRKTLFMALLVSLKDKRRKKESYRQFIVSAYQGRSKNGHERFSLPCCRLNVCVKCVWQFAAQLFAVYQDYLEKTITSS